MLYPKMQCNKISAAMHDMGEIDVWQCLQRKLRYPPSPLQGQSSLVYVDLRVDKAEHTPCGIFFVVVLCIV